jgi:hypothetical protein
MQKDYGEKYKTKKLKYNGKNWGEIIEWSAALLHQKSLSFSNSI